jgi:hypothetical protein
MPRLSTPLVPSSPHPSEHPSTLLSQFLAHRISWNRLEIFAKINFLIFAYRFGPLPRGNSNFRLIRISLYCRVDSVGDYPTYHSSSRLKLTDSSLPVLNTGMPSHAKRNGGFVPKPASSEVMWRYMSAIGRPDGRDGVSPTFPMLLDLFPYTRYRSASGKVILWIENTS